MGLLTHAGVMPTNNAQDRRLHLRLNCAGIVEVSFFPDNTPYDAILYDISMGGCGLKIENHSNTQINSLVEMKLRVHGLTLTLHGVVRNVMGVSDRVGIEFADVKPAQAIRLYQVMGELMDKSAGKMSLI